MSKSLDPPLISLYFVTKKTDILVKFYGGLDNSPSDFLKVYQRFSLDIGFFFIPVLLLDHFQSNNLLSHITLTYESFKYKISILHSRTSVVPGASE